MSPRHTLSSMNWLRFYGTLGTFTWRMLAVVLAGQAILLFFGALVARAMSTAEGATEPATRLWVGTAIAVLALVAAGLMRRPYGLTLGWIVQALTWASAVVVPMMIGVGLVFTGLWVLCLRQGDQVDRAQAARLIA